MEGAFKQNVVINNTSHMKTTSPHAEKDHELQARNTSTFSTAPRIRKLPTETVRGRHPIRVIFVPCDFPHPQIV